MFRIIIYLMLLSVLSSITPVSAEDANTKDALIIADFTPLKHTGYDHVTKIVDAQTIIVKSGKIIRLSAINIPQIPFESVSAFGLKAKEKLEEILPANTKIALYQTKNPKQGRVNRMGHTLAHITLPDGQWVQGMLIYDGLARAEPSEVNFEMAPQMYKHENNARLNKRGLWADKNYRLLPDTDARNALGNFAVIEGHIQTVASVKNKVYLNFGKNWRDDFTVMIPSAIRKKLAKAGLDPLALNNKNVRVRGWVRDYNGPLIELTHPASLEIIQTTD